MAQLLAHVVNGLQNGFCDFLGNVFMQLELGDKYRGQFFTLGCGQNDGAVATGGCEGYV